MALAIRKGQLISTFGPGAMVVDARGVSVMTCGLDHWFDESDSSSYFRYVLQDNRLAKRLNVQEFRLPPDRKDPDRGIDGSENWISAVRFPRTHICSNPACQHISSVGPEAVSIPYCRLCSSPRYQARFVVICENGHIDDFPWNEWVHRTSSPECQGSALHMKGVGSSSLAGIFVECRECRSPDRYLRRSLAGITTLQDDGSTLGKNLDEQGDYVCSGKMPWLGDEHVNCSAQPVGVLRQASNAYFSRLVSSIYLPVDAGKSPAALVDIMDKEENYHFFDLLRMAKSEEQLLENIKRFFPPEVRNFGDKDILDAFALIDERLNSDESMSDATQDALDDESETVFRLEERRLLIAGINRDALISTAMPLTDYQSWCGKYFSSISLVERLTETRALLGFDRLTPNGEKSLLEYQKQLFLELPAESSKRWLPAIQSFGEGIFLEFQPELVSSWEKKVWPRLQSLNSRLEVNSFSRRDQISPRFLLVHTFAHLLINRLVYDCGYSSASLRERLYISENEESPMAGVLIYTASGDSEGSLGGLVRMGEPGFLEKTILDALEEAEWCSSDPVCTESGSISGQGPGGLNLAACHSCTLIPETSCEEFNLFLDRRSVMSLGRNGQGFFDDLTLE
ncbi:protein of unknown function [Marinobacter sp. es.048]|uniref:DUF1998 domain-containing protein n=1 Tax=Marinobacter sp. es.048 TaxID=1761795 RepID=UPI000B5886F0|nr:DUF1998 domain-containing protein [Marinobacter sp. es.048]SNC59265.1 protein of unknown function [Marinobacter sp. es.048]